jgi:hypothetical protein
VSPAHHVWSRPGCYSSTSSTKPTASRFSSRCAMLPCIMPASYVEDARTIQAQLMFMQLCRL